MRPPDGATAPPDRTQSSRDGAPGRIEPGGAWKSPVGVLGGLGPLATAAFLARVVALTEADRDQDHLDLVVLQHSSTPDRTAFVLGHDDADPGPVMADDARRLEALGARFVVLPCNTAHHFVDQVAGALSVPLVDIVRETVAAAVSRRPGLRRVGLLATDGTRAAGVYQRACAVEDLDVVLPDEADQAVVMRVIYEQVKAGRPAVREDVLGVAGRLLDAGAELVLLGCTELSVAAEQLDLLGEPTLVDSLDALARATVVRSGHRLRS